MGGGGGQESPYNCVQSWAYSVEFFPWLGGWLVTSKILQGIINAYLMWRQINGFFIDLLTSFTHKW